MPLCVFVSLKSFDSQGGSQAIIELEADEKILSVAAKRVRKNFYRLYRILTGFKQILTVFAE